MAHAPQSIFFDWDGTLVDTYKLILEAHNHVRLYMGLEPWGIDDIFDGVSKSARELYPKLYGDKAEEAFHRLYAYIDDYHLDHLKMTHYAEVLIRDFHQREIPMAVISNKRHDILVKEIEYLGWERYFESVVGAGQAAKDKPAASPVRMAIKEMEKEVEPEQCLYIGDTETDLLCAKNAKMPVALILHGKNMLDLITQYQPDIVAKDLEDFHNQLGQAS